MTLGGGLLPGSRGVDIVGKEAVLEGRGSVGAGDGLNSGVVESESLVEEIGACWALDEEESGLSILSSAVETKKR